MRLYEEKVLYKFSTNTDGKIFFYTGYVIFESETHIKIETLRNESVILAKDSILRATEKKVV